MAKEYVILYTDDTVIVPIKAEFYPDSRNRSYQATFPQFFGGTVGGGQTLAQEVIEESQNHLALPAVKEELIHNTVGGTLYTFYKAHYAALPALFQLDLTGGVTANQREMQNILYIPKVDFGDVFTVAKLLLLCRARNGAYCDSTKCPGRGVSQWDDWGTKDAYQAFLTFWQTVV